jgi:hypothetical protein
MAGEWTDRAMKISWSAGIAVAIGAAYVYAGVAKLMTLAAFTESIRTFRLAPDGTVATLTLAIPMIEIVSGCGTWVPCWRRLSLLSLLLLTAGFLGVIASALVRGLVADCGCFGPDSGGSLWGAFGRDLGLAVALGILYWRENRRSILREDLAP